MYPFSPYVTPHSPHISEVNSIYHARQLPRQLPLQPPSADRIVDLVNPQRAPELRALLLNACYSEEIGRLVHQQLPHLSVIGWRSQVHDPAAMAFSKGLYSALATGTQVPIERAFEAGRAAFKAAGFREGDPQEYLHPRNHPHLEREWRQKPFSERRLCTGCVPPVHGLPVHLCQKRPSVS